MNTSAWLTLLLLLGQTPDQEKIQSWAQIYAPIVIHDSREQAPLTSVDKIIQKNPDLIAYCNNGEILQASIYQADFWHSEIIKTKFAQCKNNLNLSFSGQIPQPEAISYYHLQSQSRYLILQYWFFYAWNATDHLGGGPLVAACGNHEGDWEHISIRLNRDALFQAKTEQDYFAAIDDIYMAQHGRAQHKNWKYYRPDDPQLSFNHTHLKVFSALGSHASYPYAGTWPLMTIAGMTLNDIHDGKGLSMDLSQEQLKPITQEPWFVYPGRWGSMRDAGCNWVESISTASNDGSFGPGHAHKTPVFYQDDWFDHPRPMRSPEL